MTDEAFLTCVWGFEEITRAGTEVDSDSDPEVKAPDGLADQLLESYLKFRETDYLSSP